MGAGRRGESCHCASVSSSNTKSGSRETHRRLSISANHSSSCQDLANAAETELIYSFREGSGVGQHPSANRGSSTVNFALGSVENNCDDSSDFILFHGTLMLIAWMILAPLGIYYVR